MHYKFQMRDDSEPVSCDSCGSHAPVAEFEGSAGDADRKLCEFCSTTMASRHTQYPARTEHDDLRREIWKAAACVFNMLKWPDGGGHD